MQTIRVLSPRPPVRALVIGAAAEGVGVILIVAGSTWGGPGFPIIGWLLLLAGTLLALAAILAWLRMRVRVELSDDGYAIVGHEGTETGTWDEVTKVTEVPGGLVLHHGETRRVHLLDPTGSGRSLAPLGVEIGRHLDRSRGYGG